MSAQHSRRPAAYARVAATGVSLAGAVAMVGVMSAAAKPGSSASMPVTDPPVTDTEQPSSEQPSSVPAPTDSVVIIEVHRTVYVDDHGNPVDPDSVASPDGEGPGATRVPSTSIVRRSSGSGRPSATTTTVAGSTSGGGTSPTTAPPTTVRRTTTVPACSGSGCP